MLTPRPIDPNIASVSTNPGYCMEKLKTVTAFNDAFDEIQKQLELSCSPSVAQKLFEFSEYLTFLLMEEDVPKFEERKEKYISLLLKQNLSYEDIIRNLIVEHRLGGVDKFSMDVLQKLLIDNAEFRAKFADDKKYLPLFKRAFIDTLSKTNLIPLDWESIKSIPVQQDVIDDAIEKVYSFTNPYTVEQNSIIAIAKILTNKEFVLAQFAKAEIALTVLINSNPVTLNEDDK
jgi:hypothetical protein